MNQKSPAAEYVIQKRKEFNLKRAEIIERIRQVGCLPLLEEYIQHMKTKTY